MATESDIVNVKERDAVLEKLEEMTREYFPLSANLCHWNSAWKRIIKEEEHGKDS